MLVIGAAPHALEYVLLAALVCALSGRAAFGAIVHSSREAQFSLRGCAIVAVSLGLGIWSTHFIAMLGLRPDFLISYSLPETIGSIFIACLFSGGVMAWAARRKERRLRLAGAATSGVAISSMHHVGMIGLSSCIVTFDFAIVAAATLAIGGLFAAALDVAKSAARFASIKAAAIMSAGVVTLHFGSIAATTFQIGPAADLVMSADMLALLQLISILVLLIPFYRIAREAYKKYRDIQLSGYVAMATGEGVVNLDVNGRILWVSAAFESLTGMKSADFEGFSGAEIVESVAGRDKAARFQRALDDGSSTEFTISHKRPDGEFYWLRVRLIPRQSESGKLLGFVAANQDVTAEVQARASLKRSEAAARQLAMVAQHATDAILITDADGGIIWVNDAFCQLTGYTLDEVAGAKPGSFLQGPGTLSATVRKISKALKAVEPIKCEIMNYTKEGDAYWVQLSIAPVQNRNDPLCFIATSRNVTKRIEREKNLVDARKKAEVADRMKSEFLARMSHEIRTPMNGVMGMAELLATTEMDERQELFLSHIRSSSERLQHLVNDILDFSTLDRGEISLEQAPFDLAEMAYSAIEEVREGVDLKGLTATATISPDAPERVIGDQERIQQILQNLLNNAVKFTDAGSVSLTVLAREDVSSEPGMATLLFSVTDTGVGVPPTMQEHIFDRFTQADGSARRRSEGAGLGLSIAAGLAKAMGGALTLESTPGEGSTFTLSLPLAVDAAAEVTPADLQRALLKRTVEDAHSIAVE